MFLSGQEQRLEPFQRLEDCLFFQMTQRVFWYYTFIVLCSEEISAYVFLQFNKKENNYRQEL